MRVELVAPAKVNLTLEVIGRRPDGYHETASLMQTVEPSDRVVVESADSLLLDVAGDEVAGVPLEGPENLAFRAALVMHEHVRVAAGARIRVEKRIPVGMGLGGGSTDAAAVLRGLNLLWGAGLSTRDLEALAATVGSDVPFFINCGTAAARGRGEVILPLQDHAPRPLTLFVAAVALPQKTRLMYSLLTPAAFTDGKITRAAETAVRRALPVLETDVFNAFDRYVEEAAPEMARSMRLCRDRGVPVWACGSGPGFFALQAKADLPPLLEREMAAHGVRLIESRFLTREEALVAREA